MKKYLCFALAIIFAVSADIYAAKNSNKGNSQPNKEDSAFVPGSGDKKLDQNLQEGSSFNINIEASKTIKPVNRRVMGISFHSVKREFDLKSGAWNLPERVTKAISDLHIPFSCIRYIKKDEKWGLTEEVDKIAQLSDKLGIDQKNFMINIDPGLSPSSAEEWADTAKHAVDKGYKFRLWEIGNEVYLHGGINGFNLEKYTEHVKNVSKAIKNVEPEAKTSISVTTFSSYMDWTNKLIKSAAGYYDFVTPHLYGYEEKKLLEKLTLEEMTFDENAKVMKQALHLRALLDAANKNKKVEILDTEWGLSGKQSGTEDPTFANRNGNICGTLHRAIRLIYYVNQDIVDGAGQWEIPVNRVKSCGFGIIPKWTNETPAEIEETRCFLLYYLNYYFGRYTGDEVVEVSGTCPYYSKGNANLPKVPVLITKSSDGKKLFIIAANGTASNNLQCTVNIKGFTADSEVKGVVLTQAGLDSPALVDRESDVIKELPLTVKDNTLKFTSKEHSVSFISLTAK